jgi:hypothetical protein
MACRVLNYTTTDNTILRQYNTLLDSTTPRQDSTTLYLTVQQYKSGTMENKLEEYVKSGFKKGAVLEDLVYNEMSMFRFSYGHTT